MTVVHISLDLCSLIQVDTKKEPQAMPFITLNPPAHRSQPLFLSAHLRSVAMRELIEESLTAGGATGAWPPSSPDCGRVMKMVHFGHNKMTDPCHCPDQTFGVGGVKLDGAVCVCWLRNFPTFLLLTHDSILTHFTNIWMEMTSSKPVFCPIYLSPLALQTLFIYAFFNNKIFIEL